MTFSQSHRMRRTRQMFSTYKLVQSHARAFKIVCSEHLHCIILHCSVSAIVFGIEHLAPLTRDGWAVKDNEERKRPGSKVVSLPRRNPDPESNGGLLYACADLQSSRGAHRVLPGLASVRWGSSKFNRSTRGCSKRRV